MKHNYLLLGSVLLMLVACSDSQESVDMEATKKYCEQTGGRFLEGKGCLPSPERYVEVCKKQGLKYDSTLDGCVEN
ncbi:MAG: hypothetical protein HN764_05990 [Gammaproteobacteria bacterium]|jgi:hypothetical protein|nr:hypothetical protein [Gammaproteobacteria bacterium]